MSDYFDRVEQGMREAVRRRAHLPWYVRLRGIGRARGLLIVLGALVVTTPAVGAATSWFGIGAPERFISQSPTQLVGRALRGTSELLGLRVPDPQGGPPWGLRLVGTTRGDTCIQVGRVEDGRLGSLGIDGAWNDDHLFHPFPNTSTGAICETTDAVGHDFVNVAGSGVVANANPPGGVSGAQAKSCSPLLIPLFARLRLHRLHRRASSAPPCPPGSVRMVFMGLLGPDATSITYEAPDGSLKTEKTSGADGAYLLVFTLDRATCDLYTHSPYGSYGPCGAGSVMGASLGPIGAVKAVTYRNGHVCRLSAPSRLLAAYRRFVSKLRPRQLGRLLPAHRRAWQAALRARRAAFKRFLASNHLTRASFQALYNPSCPPVGYARAKQKPLTTADVATPITVKLLPRASGEFQVELIFTARQAVTSSSSWYEDYFNTPPGCYTGPEGGEIGFGNIPAGQVIHDRRPIGSCKGTYHGLIGYMQNSGPIDQEASGGGMPGQDGSLVVGRFTFTIR